MTEIETRCRSWTIKTSCRISEVNATNIRLEHFADSEERRLIESALDFRIAAVRHYPLALRFVGCPTAAAC